MSSYSPGGLPWEPTIYNVTMTVANTEYSQQLPVKTMKILMHTRDESIWRLAFETGHVAGSVAPFLTVLANTRYYSYEVNLRPTLTAWDGTLYFATANAGRIVEVSYWMSAVV